MEMIFKKQQKQKPTPKLNINQNKPTNMYIVLMNEGVQNRQRELLKIKNKEINKETKKHNCDRYTRGQYTNRQGIEKS